jgi:hypothetical protein
MNSMPEPTNHGDRINDTRTPAERLLDVTMRRWAAEHRNFLEQLQKERLAAHSPDGSPPALRLNNGRR